MAAPSAAQGISDDAVEQGLISAQSSISESAYASKDTIVLFQQSAKNHRKYRSKSAVIADVKRRYNARVLKIALNKKLGVYRVRILMPNGKVRVVSVSAKH